MKGRERSEPIAFFFALPHLVLFAVFLLAPVLYGAYVSLHSWHVLARERPFVALANYRARGFRVFKEESAEVDLPDVSPGPWPGAR